MQFGLKFSIGGFNFPFENRIINDQLAPQKSATDYITKKKTQSNAVLTNFNLKIC
jgi:hypothetical protein